MEREKGIQVKEREWGGSWREGARRKCETVKVRAAKLRGRRVYTSLFLKYIASKITNLPIKLLPN